MGKYEEKLNEIDKYLNGLDKESQKIAKLYNRREIIDVSGPENKKQQPYTDFVAEWILRQNSLFMNFDNKSERVETYFKEDHYGIIEKITNRSEEIFAKNLQYHYINYLGWVLDYQVPLKNILSDDFGKFDLVSFDKKLSTAFLIELKMAEGNETLLRATLEIETYYHLLKKEKFKNDLKGKVKNLFTNKTMPKFNTENLKLRKAVLFVIEGNNQSDLPKELQNEHAGRYNNLRKLLAEYEIGVFTIPQAYPVQRMGVV